MIQNRDGSIVEKLAYCRPNRRKRQDYYAIVPAQLLDEQNSLIDRIIGFAFDTLGVRRLEVRVHDEPDAGFLVATGKAHMSQCQPLCTG